VTSKTSWLLAGILIVAGTRATPAQEIPDEGRRMLMNALGTPFMVFRDKVMDELKVTDEQRQKLFQHFGEEAKRSANVFDSREGPAEEREKKVSEHKKKAQERLAKFLKDTLKADQLKRLRQLELQREGLRTIADRPDLLEALKITQQQKMQFVPIFQEMQKKIAPLIKEKGNPEEILPKVRKLLNEASEKLEAVLDDAQKKQWKDMLGKPFDLGD
jgi:hypothetical protein